MDLSSCVLAKKGVVKNGAKERRLFHWGKGTEADWACADAPTEFASNQNAENARKTPVPARRIATFLLTRDRTGGFYTEMVTGCARGRVPVLSRASRETAGHSLGYF